MASATRFNEQFELRLNKDPEDPSSNKWQHMGLDKHLQVSTVAGLIEKYHGASNYLNDRQDPAQAYRTLISRAKSRKEYLHLPTLLSQTPRLPIGDDAAKPEATHVVVGVIYGAEAYCVLSSELDGDDGEDARAEADVTMSIMSTKWKIALADSQDLVEFKDQFDREEKKRFNRLKCRLYADLQTQTVRECTVFEAYKQCLNLIDQIQNTKEIKNSKAVPIAVLLCPLKALVEQTGGFRGTFENRDVDANLVARCCRIWAGLEKIGSKADALRAVVKKENRSRLRRFADAIVKYQEILRKSLKEGVVKVRESSDGSAEEFEKVLVVAESHLLFKPSRLKRWLFYEQAELKMADLVANVNGITFLDDVGQLDRVMGFSLEKKCALILKITHGNEQTYGMLYSMTDYVKSNKIVALDRFPDDDFDDDGDSTEDEEEEGGIPFHTVQFQQRIVKAKIREMMEHMKKNEHLENQVEFFVTLGDRNKKFECSYFVYQTPLFRTPTPLKSKLRRLPVAPTGLKVHVPTAGRAKRARTTSSSIRVKWDYEELGFPCHFLVQFRAKGSSDCWTQLKTTQPDETQMAITAEPGSVLEIRVAADTCIGRSDFSDVIDTEFAVEEEEEVESDPDQVDLEHVRKQNNPMAAEGETQVTKTVAHNWTNILQPPSGIRVELVTQTTVELSWSSPSLVPCNVGRNQFSFHVRYWPNGQDASSAKLLKVSLKETFCRLDQLQPETAYSVNIVVDSDDGKKTSASSKTASFTTLAKGVRFAEMLVKKCAKNVGRDEMDVYSVPLTKTGNRSGNGPSSVERYIFGKAGKKEDERKQHKTILLMGATGSGKTGLINAMMNYILNVDWRDPFRFRLIEEQQQLASSRRHKNRVNVYEVNHYEGFRIPYSVTIIDTPEYDDAKNLAKNQEITDLIRKFFENKDGIQEVDVVGFVVDASQPRLTPTESYMFESILSIFGNDVKENISFLLNFADNQNPPVADSLCPARVEPLLKFNSRAFFNCNRKGPVPGMDESCVMDCEGSFSYQFNLVTNYKFNSFLWHMGVENFYAFFSSLAGMKTKSVSFIKQMLDERKRLEAIVDGLQPLINTGLVKMEEFRKTIHILTNCRKQMEDNIDVGFELEVDIAEKVEMAFGQYLNNCSVCNTTCHNPCGIDEEKADCDVMDHSMPAAIRTCRVCPGKCPWNLHANQPFRWEYVRKAQTTSTDAVKKLYEAKANGQLSAEELVAQVEEDAVANEAAVLGRVLTVTKSMQRLDEMAKRDNSLSVLQFINQMMAAEKKEKRTGFEERNKSLKRIRLLAVIKLQLVESQVN